MVLPLGIIARARVKPLPEAFEHESADAQQATAPDLKASHAESTATRLFYRTQLAAGVI